MKFPFSFMHAGFLLLSVGMTEQSYAGYIRPPGSTQIIDAETGKVVHERWSSPLKGQMQVPGWKPLPLGDISEGLYYDDERGNVMSGDRIVAHVFLSGYVRLASDSSTIGLINQDQFDAANSNLAGQIDVDDEGATALYLVTLCSMDPRCGWRQDFFPINPEELKHRKIYPLRPLDPPTNSDSSSSSSHDSSDSNNKPATVSNTNPNAITHNGSEVATVDSQGRVYSNTGGTLGTVDTQNGRILDSYGHQAGTIDSQGIRDNNGKVVASFDGSDRVLDSNGHQIGEVGSDGSVSSGSQNLGKVPAGDKALGALMILHDHH
ncbi:hypothetical protein PT277_05520 [Acetobacteraceae bacterium ESL0709]|nr:hypothetical protein [Acetobacteraceae bacterium ESL0697]MDF7678155.1 hypothetical protein [Acetobacteraceae bacterium ESL0709]